MFKVKLITITRFKEKADINSEMAYCYQSELVLKKRSNDLRGGELRGSRDRESLLNIS